MANTNTPPANTAPTAEEWQALIDRLEKGKGGVFLFPKDGKTRLRLLLQNPNRPFDFFQETSRWYQGQSRTRYLILCLNPDDESRKDMVQAVVVNKTTLKAIIGLLADGYDLFDHEKGYGVTIARGGKGLETSYTVLPSKQPIKVDTSSLEWPTLSLADLAIDFENNSRNKDISRGYSGSELTDDDIPF